MERAKGGRFSEVSAKAQKSLGEMERVWVSPSSRRDQRLCDREGKEREGGVSSSFWVRMRTNERKGRLKLTKAFQPNGVEFLVLRLGRRREGVLILILLPSFSCRDGRWEGDGPPPFESELSASPLSRFVFDFSLVHFQPPSS